MADYKIPLQPGDEIEIIIQDIFSGNYQNGMSVHRNYLVEIQMGGNRIGDELKVMVTSVQDNYVTAQIKE